MENMDKGLTTEMGADSSAENTPNSQEYVQFGSPCQKVRDFN